MQEAVEKAVQKDWLVVGGGLQGCYFAALLSHQYQNVAILDPQPSLLHRWLQRSKACRMKFMRSTSVHHLAPNPSDLLDFAQIRGYGAEHFTEPYLRPSLALFNAHCQEILHSFRLEDIHVQGELCALERTEDAQEGIWQARYIDASAQEQLLQSENVLLALGDQGAHWGEYAQDAKAEDGRAGSAVWHLSDPNFSLEGVLKQMQQLAEREARAAVPFLVGGGISSVQLALHFLRQNMRVKIQSRHPLHCFQFDSEPGWLFKLLHDFHEVPSLAERWQIIKKERHKGSIPPQLYEQLQSYVQEGGLLEFTVSDVPVFGDVTILATGLEYRVPDWLLALAECLNLPLLETESGLKPALSNSLLWDAQKAPGLYLAGRLGELFLGPAAGNIVGARIAARYLPVDAEHPGSFLGPGSRQK